jgi:ADP-ribosylglycohydrolase
MTELSQKRAGLVLGSFTADALSLGVHWIYDTDLLSQKFGYIKSYHAPGSDSYHPNKQAGDQGHVGDQALRLADFLSRENTWHAESFMQDWLAMWPAYDDYIDHATKTTLGNIKAGNNLLESGSDSSELAGPARIAPLVAFLANEPEEHVIAAAIEQTRLTHHSAKAIEAARFLAIASYRLIHGAELQSTLEATAPAWALQQAKAVLNCDTIKAIHQLGQSCAIDNALPAALYCAFKYGDNLPKALSENALAGGDNCARALALGMLLGAAHGSAAIPAEWQKQLNTQIPQALFQ